MVGVKYQEKDPTSRWDFLVREFADFANLRFRPNRQRYFGCNAKRNAYIEIKSFKKDIDDAQNP